MSRLRFQVTFVTLCLLVPLAFRVWLTLSRRGDLADLGVADFATLFVTGTRLDAILVAGLTAPVALALLLVPGRWLRGTLRLASWGAALAFLLLAGAELAGLQFFSFYDFRPNYIVLEHGTDPEVLKTIVAAYPVFWVAVGTVVIGAVLFLALRRAAPLPAPGAPSWGWSDRIAMLVVLAVTAFAARGTLDHRPLNPSVAAFSSNRLANELAGNGTYNVVYEAFQRRRERYGAVKDCIEDLPVDEAVAATRTHLAPTGSFVEGAPNPIVRDVQAPARESCPRNVILVTMESFTGRLIGHLGGELSLSPNLDALAADGLAFTRCYATGERTIQGLESVISSFPPLPGVGVIRRPETRVGFETLGTVLGRRGYATSFVYGGQGIFDQMRGFFLANGYQSFVEERDFGAPVFTGAWGVSDEDLYRNVIARAADEHAAGRPFLITALTVSLHSPWEYPDGRITPLPEETAVPDGFEKEELDTFLYADHAIGILVDEARAEPWFDDTLFVFVADHGVHLRGRMTVPVEEYRVPAVFYAPKHVPPQRLDRVTSQLDVAPTILGLLGGETRTTFFGVDALARPADPGFAVMVYRKERYAALAGDDLVLLTKEKGGARRRDATEDGFSPCASTPAHEATSRTARGVLVVAEDLLLNGTYRAE